MIAELLQTGAVRSVYQPIIRLATAEVVGYEALARGPEGPLANPMTMFAAAAEAGCTAQLDALCRSAAFRGAAELGLAKPLTIFVNVEPEALDSAGLEHLVVQAETVSSDLQVVLEITERSLVARPAELIRTVERVRELGWRVALDDVGAETASLAFMPLLRPDVVKLDLRLVQQRPGQAVAEIMSAVNAYAERSGAVVLAEGIEDEKHLGIALGLGATLGQGWMFGRPLPVAVPGAQVGQLVLPPVRVRAGTRSPFDCLPGGTSLRTSPKSLLIELSKQLEREALRVGETCVVASTFQEARHFTPATAQRYRLLAERLGFVCALGEDLAQEPVPGVRGAELSPDDPIRGEWDVVVLGPHFSAALLARDLGDVGPDRDRSFEFALTYDRDTVVAAGQAMISRVAPRGGEMVGESHEVAPPPLTGTVRPDGAPSADALLHRALGATSSGVAIADMTRPDQPLVYVNRAFELLTGESASELLGRNCRFMQGVDSDPSAVARLRQAIAEGGEARETVLNYRGPGRIPWWNEVHLSPVRNAAGRVVQYIGVQQDVTARVEAERDLATERERSGQYLGRIEKLANTDPLTGLMNRRRLEQEVEVALLEARMSDRSVAILFLDLDDFKPVNDLHGHVVGDRLLKLVGRRLRSTLRHTDLVARLGGDEFLVALPDLDPRTAVLEAQRLADVLKKSVAAPVVLGDRRLSITTSVGVCISPFDAGDFGAMLHIADLRMYESKHPETESRTAVK